MSDYQRGQAYGADGQVIQDVGNRGHDNKLDDNDQSPIQITLMSIDETIVNYLNDTIKPTIVDNETVRMVPVLYGTPERWATFRKDGIIRDPVSDKALTPSIMLRRTGVERDKMTNPSNKYLETAYETGWNRRNAYDKFAVLNNIRPSRQFHAIIIPDYVTISYDVVLWTEYEQQMSDLVGQIQVEGDEYWGTRNGFKFRVRIDGFDSQTDLEATQDRVVRTTFSMKVSAYLVPERMVKNFKLSPTTRKTYTAKKIVVMTEVDGTGAAQPLRDTYTGS
jgi:hypothetical protein